MESHGEYFTPTESTWKREKKTGESIQTRTQKANTRRQGAETGVASRTRAFRTERGREHTHTHRKT